MEGRFLKNFQKNQNFSKMTKIPIILPKSVQTCFEHVLGQFFWKVFAQFSMKGRDFENFQKDPTMQN